METERKDTTVVDYRATFSTDAGKRVLAHLLLESGYFDCDLKTEGEIAVLNFVKKIIRNLGICTEPKDVAGFVQKLMELPNKI